MNDKESYHLVMMRLHEMNKRMTDLEAAFYELKDAFYHHSQGEVERDLDAATKGPPWDNEPN